MSDVTEPNGYPKTLALALAVLQTKLPEVRKTEKGQAGNRETQYADLANISSHLLPLLGGLGLSFSARPTLNATGQFVLAYELLHISGESKTGEYPIKSGGPQAIGSEITYARRYTLNAVTGLAPEDDDDAASAEAEAAAARGTARRQTPVRNQPAQPQRTERATQRAKPPVASSSDRPPLPGEDEPEPPIKPSAETLAEALHAASSRTQVTSVIERMRDAGLANQQALRDLVNKRWAELAPTPGGQPRREWEPTQPQIKRLYALMKAANVNTRDEEACRAYVNTLMPAGREITSWKDFTREEYEAVTGAIERTIGTPDEGPEETS